MDTLYISMNRYIHQHTVLKSVMTFVCQYSPYITLCVYPCLLIYLIIQQSSLFWITVFKPFIALVIVTILRKIVNRPRPYESLPIQPLLGHKTGESFPSRHTLSAFIIALVCFPVSTVLGYFCIVIAILISVSRVIAGVHYISDIFIAICIAFLIHII